MKKSLLAVAVLGAFAGAASAQSSVTLFGIVDLSANYTKNGNRTLKSLDSNQLNSNRLGFRGTEDLGGGLLAGFWLEGGMANDTGLGGNTSGGFDFARRSTVSLTSKAGEIRLGRDYTNTFSNRAGADAYGANGFGSSINLYASGLRKLGPNGTGLNAGGTNALMNSGATTVVRANNMIGYFTPAGLGGLYGSAQVAAGEGVAGNKYVGFRLGYAAGPLDVAVATSQTSTEVSDKFKVINVGGSFDAGVVKVYALWDQAKFAGAKYTTWQLSAGVPLGQGELRGSYSRGKADGVTSFSNTSGTPPVRTITTRNTNGDGANLLGLEYIYNLSKRTALYTQYGRLSNKGRSDIQLLGTTVDADITAGGFTSTAYGLGVRHSF